MGPSEIRVPPSATEKEALEHIYGLLSGGAEHVGKSFVLPDDDWISVWAFISRDGFGTIISGDLHKYDMVERVGQLAREFDAVAAGSLNSSWGLIRDDIGPERMEELRQLHLNGMPLSEMPESSELLVLVLYTAGTVEAHSAIINRFDDRPPTLQPWEKFGADEIGGRMVEPIQAALRRIG